MSIISIVMLWFQININIEASISSNSDKQTFLTDPYLSCPVDGAYIPTYLTAGMFYQFLLGKDELSQPLHPAPR